MRLRLAGIKVNSEEEYLKSVDGARLYVNIHAFNHESFLFYSWRLSFKQHAILTRKPHRVSYGVTTWDKSKIGRCSRSEFRETVRDSVKGQTDKFINHYFKANSKE